MCRAENEIADVISRWEDDNHEIINEIINPNGRSSGPALQAREPLAIILPKDPSSYLSVFSPVKHLLQSEHCMALRLPSLSRGLALPTRVSRTTALPRLNQTYLHTSPRIMTTANGDNGDPGHLEGDLNQWKFRAPYKVHDNDPNFHVRYRGSCHCGKIKYQLSRERPLDSKYCHCSTCQKLHGQFPLAIPRRAATDPPHLGAPFQWAAIFHKDDINFTHGHHDLGWYESSEKTCVHKLPCKVSCAYCRTPIMDEGRNMILLFPTLIDFESPEDRKNFDIRYVIAPQIDYCQWVAIETS